LSRAIAALAIALSLAGAAGCGGDDESSPAEATELAITLDADGPGGESAETAEITCPGANAPPQACAAIRELPDDPAAPVPLDTPCTEIYGGPDVVELEGTLEGEEVDAELTRENGCEIERFDHFLPLLAALFPEYEPGASIGA
jgi:hypothetical protein